MAMKIKNILSLVLCVTYALSQTKESERVSEKERERERGRKRVRVRESVTDKYKT